MAGEWPALCGLDEILRQATRHGYLGRASSRAGSPYNETSYIPAFRCPAAAFPKNPVFPLPLQNARNLRY